MTVFREIIEQVNKDCIAPYIANPLECSAIYNIYPPAP